MVTVDEMGIEQGIEKLPKTLSKIIECCPTSYFAATVGAVSLVVPVQSLLFGFELNIFLDHSHRGLFHIPHPQSVHASDQVLFFLSVAYLL